MASTDKPAAERIPALNQLIADLKVLQVQMKTSKNPRTSGSIQDDILMLTDIIKYGAHGGKVSCPNEHTRKLMEERGFADLIHPLFTLRQLHAI